MQTITSMIIRTPLTMLMIKMMIRWPSPPSQQERTRQERKTWLIDNSLFLTGLICTITFVILIIIMITKMIITITNITKKGKAGNRTTMASHDIGQTRGGKFDGDTKDDDDR